MHLADAFIQSYIQCIQAINFFISLCVPWELNPQHFALLTQCSTTEPQEHSGKALAFKIVSFTLAGSYIGSRRGSIHEGSTALARDAKLCLSQAREHLVSVLSAMGLLLRAVLTWGTKSGSSRVGPPREQSISGLSDGRCTGKHWANHGPEHLAVSINKLGTESCLLRQKGLPLPSQRQTKFLDLSEDVGSILPE